MEHDIEYWKCLAGSLQRQRNAALDQVAELQAVLTRSNQIASERAAAQKDHAPAAPEVREQ